MLYGSEKVEHMARSILPSSARKGARESLALIKRRARSDMRRRLRTLCYDDYDDRVDDFNFYPQSRAKRGAYFGSIKDIVYERRGADKLAHFERWAIKRTAHIEEPDARLAKMRAMLPDGLIGSHAISHLVNYDEFDVERRYGGYFSPRAVAERRAQRKAETLVEQETHLEKLREVVRSHRLKKLNRALKRGHNLYHWDWREEKQYRCEHCGHPRLLLGLHDVEAFYYFIFANVARQHSEARAIVQRYLEDDFA